MEAFVAKFEEGSSGFRSLLGDISSALTQEKELLAKQREELQRDRQDFERECNRVAQASRPARRRPARRRRQPQRSRRQPHPPPPPPPTHRPLARPPQVFNDAEQVVLNIGGSKFTTTLGTLRNAAAPSLFSAMFSGRHALKVDKEGCYFIDRRARVWVVVVVGGLVRACVRAWVCGGGGGGAGNWATGACSAAACSTRGAASPPRAALCPPAPPTHTPTARRPFTCPPLQQGRAPLPRHPQLPARRLLPPARHRHRLQVPAGAARGGRVLRADGAGGAD
jgi:hypothetical protein